MKFLLDTNTCIRYLNGRSPAVFQRLNQTSETDICVCSMVKFEMQYGALRSNDVEKSMEKQKRFLDRFVSLPLDESAFMIAAQIRADLARAATPIGPYDLLIGAIALANDVILVTHNTREFSRVAGLRFEDWEVGDAP